MSLPTMNQLLSNALRELATASDVWTAGTRAADYKDWPGSSAAFKRLEKARERIEELAHMLYPAKEVPAKAPKPTSPARKTKASPRVPLQLTTIEPLRLLPAPKVSR